MYIRQILLPLVIEKKITPEEADCIALKIGAYDVNTSMVEIYKMIREVLHDR